MLHGFGLSRTTHPRYGDAHVEGWPDAGVEQVCLQVYLPIGDGDDVGGDVGSEVAQLGLDDGESGKRATAVLGGQLGCPLQKARVEIEDVAWVGFAARGAPQKQAHLAISPSVLCEVVVDNKGVLPLLHEFLAHGTASVRGNVLQSRRLRSRGHNHNGMVHGPILLQGGHHASYVGLLLPNGHIYADQVLALLVDDGVNGQGRFACLAVPND